MKTTELRIGNFVGMFLLTSPDNYFRVLEVGQTMKVTDYWKSEKPLNTDFYDIEDLEPIPLDDEWFKEFGFQKSVCDGELFWELMAGGYLFMKGDKNGFTECFVDLEQQPRVRYVHELQNLYYALTKHELVLAVSPKEKTK